MTLRHAGRRLRSAALLLCLAAGAVRALAQAPAAGQDAAAEPKQFDSIMDLVEEGHDDPPVVFTYENREIFPLHARIFGRSPAERASTARNILDELVDDHTIAPVTVRRIQGGALLFVANTGIIGIAASDVIGWTGESFDDAVARARHNLERALQEALEGRSPHQLLRGLLKAGIATGLVLLLLRGLLALSAEFLRRLKRHAEAEAVRLRESAIDVTIYGVRSLNVVLLRTGRLLALVIGLMALWVWLTYTLLQFPYLRPVGESLSTNLKALLSSALHTALASIPDLIVAVLILIVARFVARGANSFFAAVKAGRVSVPWIDRQVAEPTRKLVVFALWVFAVVLTYPYLPGSGTEGFRGITVLLGLVFSLGSTGMVSQAVAGLMLMYSRMLRVGDYVRIGQSEGTVAHISMLATRLRTVYDEELVLPNAVVMSQTTVNFSRLQEDGGARLTTDVTIGYDAPWRQVHAMLLRAVELTPGLRRLPPAAVMQLELGDFWVRYRLLASIEVPSQRVPVLSALHRNIQDQFNEHGVQIMSPHYMSSPSQPLVVPKERWRAEPADPAGD